jgi:hypothetical protein
LADFADTLDAVGELDESKKPAQHLALQAILGFFQSAGVDKEILHRLWQQQEEIEQLKKNLRRADAMEDPLQATLFTLAHINTHFEPLGIKSTILKKLENALSDVLHGHPHPLFKPNRQGKTRDEKRSPDTRRRKRVSICASALMQVHMDANGNDAFDAAATVARVLSDEGFKLTKRGAYATAETVMEWRKGIRGLPASSWESGLYTAMIQPGGAFEGLFAKAIGPQARKWLIDLVEQRLKEAIAEAS